MKELTPGKIKKAGRKLAKKDLSNFYVFVKNDRTGKTKLVSREKSMDYTHGKFNYIGIREHNLKDTYTLVEVK